MQINHMHMCFGLELKLLNATPGPQMHAVRLNRCGCKDINVKQPQDIPAAIVGRCRSYQIPASWNAERTIIAAYRLWGRLSGPKLPPGSERNASMSATTASQSTLSGLPWSR